MIDNDLWLASLINENNPNKSRSVHGYLTGKTRPEKHKFIWYVFFAARRYFSFLYSKLYFKKPDEISSNVFVFTYGSNHLEFLTESIDCLEIVLPQRPDYKRIKELNKTTIFSFVSYFDFLVVPFLYLKMLVKFIVPVISTHDFLRSFVGDVCVENLFYSRLFRRIGKRIRNVNRFVDCRVCYVHEGQGLEKLLCKNLSGIHTTGVVCSPVSENLLNFFSFDKQCVPYRLAVLGKKQKKQFSRCHENVVVYGAGRYTHLYNVRRIKEEGSILVVLPYDRELSYELLDFVRKSYPSIYNIYVRYHPEIKYKEDPCYEKDSLPLSESLDRSRIVITTGDTSIGFDALARGCLVVVVDLKDRGFAQLNPLAYNDLCHTVSKFKQLGPLIKFGVLRKEDTVENRHELLLEYFDFSKSNEQMVYRILDD